MKALIFLTFITCISQVVGAIRINKRNPVKDASFDAGAPEDTIIFKAKVKLSKGEIDRGVTIAKVEFQLKNPTDGNQDWETGMVRERSNSARRVFNCIFDSTLPDIPGEWKWRLRATDSNGTSKTSVFYLMTIAEGDADPTNISMTSGLTSSPRLDSNIRFPLKAHRFTASSIALSVSKANFAIGEDIVVNFNFPNTFGNGAWVSIWPAEADASALPSPSPFWNYVCSDSQEASSSCVQYPASGTVTLNADSEATSSWPLTCGTWKVYLIENDATFSSYTSAAATTEFTIANIAECAGKCTAALEPVSNNSHEPPVDGMIVNKMAFGSCFKPANQVNEILWKHVRNTFQAGVWNWLGDNMYMDTDDLDLKRTKYNAARDDQYYSAYGPVADPKIPTTGTWDDHDYAWNNMGNDYSCREQSQNEFVHHFNIPSSDPRHPDKGAIQQEGIYSAYMFNKDATNPNGIHLINLDGRYHRSNALMGQGPCEGASSTILGETQWAWLQAELNKPSEIKVIGSGIQVLPPTNQDRNLNDYCAYSAGGASSFSAANAALNEGPGVSGTSYESWGEFPQERTRLLHMCQESLNAGKAKHIVFISGDQHWAEIMAKKVPSREGQAAVTLYEVTASGIDQSWNEAINNPNRVTYQKANSSGSGDFVYECNFPFIYQGITHNECISTNHNAEWCYHKGNGVGDWEYWGNCEPVNNLLVPTDAITASKAHTCTGNSLHVCTAQANYGGIEVDWVTAQVKMSIFTPHESDPVAGSVTLDL